MDIEANYSPLMQINAPEWFKEKAFLDWLNNTDHPVMTWHCQGNDPDEWSDVMVFVDPGLSGEGDQQDVMPAVYWNFIVEQCRANFGPSGGFPIVVRITNL